MRYTTIQWALLITVSFGLMGEPIAQTRSISAQAKVGVLEMTVFPEARLDGELVRFGAGARILNHGNRLVLPVSLTGTLRVAYVRDFQGLLRTVWLINEAEAKALQDSGKN